MDIKYAMKKITSGNLIINNEFIGYFDDCMEEACKRLKTTNLSFPFVGMGKLYRNIRLQDEEETKVGEIQYTK